MRDSTRFVKVNTLVPRFRNDGLRNDPVFDARSGLNYLSQGARHFLYRTTDSGRYRRITPPTSSVFDVRPDPSPAHWFPTGVFGNPGGLPRKLPEPR
jgi:hypothetical protein